MLARTIDAMQLPASLSVSLATARAAIAKVATAYPTGKLLSRSEYINEQAKLLFTLPVVSLGVVVVLAILAGILAAVRPARRAARLDILRAIARH